MKTEAVHVRSSFDVYCGRANPRYKGFPGGDGQFGNPFVMAHESHRNEVIAKHKEYLLNRIQTEPAFKEAIHSLYGKRLACFCKPKACHVDNIVDYLENS